MLCSPTTVVVDEGSATTTTTSISDVHPDVIHSHILTRLDGLSLASLSCASSQLHSLSNNETLWSDICLSTWPSTDHPRMRQLISDFPNGGPRSFFSSSFPLLISSQNPNPPSPSPSPSLYPVELISAVDLHYKGKLILSKVQETETDSSWFRCSPFRIDLLDPKDVVPTPIHPTQDTCAELSEGLSLSWIIVNPMPMGKQAANLSSWRPVSVQRHWLTNDIQVRFATILTVDQEVEVEVQCGIIVTLGREMQVRELSLQVEDMDGIHLNGKESLGILQRAMEGGERKRGGREEGGTERYQGYVKRAREMRERNSRREGRLDAACVAIGLSVLVSFFILVIAT